MLDYTLKKLPLDNKFDSPEILNLTIAANEILAELDRAILKIPNYSLVLEPLTVREAVASSEIENIRTTTIEMLQAELTNSETLPSAQREVLHYKKSLMRGLETVQKNNQLLLEDLVAIQSGIVPEKTGLRNRGGVYIGNRLGEVIYIPPQDLVEINDYIKNLFEYIESKTSNSLVKIILTHYQFEAIHPFFDGNGRAGRILMALQFVLEKKLQYPILYTSGYIVKNKATYYELFREIQENDNWDNWIIFHLNGILNQAREAILRVREIEKLQEKFISGINQAIKLPKKNQDNIQNYFFSKAFYTQTDMARVLNISRNTSKKYLEILGKNQLLESRQAGKELLYFISEFIEILS